MIKKVQEALDRVTKQENEDESNSLKIYCRIDEVYGKFDIRASIFYTEESDKEAVDSISSRLMDVVQEAAPDSRSTIRVQEFYRMDNEEKFNRYVSSFKEDK